MNNPSAAGATQPASASVESTCWSLAATCRAAVFLAIDRPLEIREFPVPAPEAHEALVAIECATICGSDLHTVKGLRHEPTPSILGHEAIGRIVSVGAPPLQDVFGDTLRMGDRVTWSTAVSCGNCDRCTGGLPQKCRSLTKYGHDLAEGRMALSGGLSEYLLLRPGSAVIKLTADIPAEVVCPANCATATVACALRYAQPLAAARVLIAGAGMLGLTAAAMAKTMQAASVTVIDTSLARLEYAKQFGADHVVLWEDDPVKISRSLTSIAGTDRFDVLLEFSGSSSAIATLYQCCDVGGRVILVGTVMPSPAVAVDPEQLVRRCMSIRGVHNYAPDDLVSAVQFLQGAQHRYPFAALVQKAFRLDDVNNAFSYASNHRPVRTAIFPAANSLGGDSN